MGQSWGSDGDLLEALLASAGPRNISQNYGQWAEGSFPVLGPPWKLGQRHSSLKLNGGRRITVTAAREADKSGSGCCQSVAWPATGYSPGQAGS